MRDRTDDTIVRARVAWLPGSQFVGKLHVDRQGICTLALGGSCPKQDMAGKCIEPNVKRGRSTN